MTVMVQCTAIFVHTDVQFLTPPTLVEHLAGVPIVPTEAAVFLGYSSFGVTEWDWPSKCEEGLRWQINLSACSNCYRIIDNFHEVWVLRI